MVAIIPLLFAVVGVLLYALPTNAKIQQIGIWMFAGSWVALMFSLASRTIRIL